MKPGWKTTEWWALMGGHLLNALLAYLLLHLSSSGLPPLVVAIALPLIGIAAQWANARYGDNRTEIKMRAIAAGAAATPPAPLNR